jgi:glycosyltransferase involved in cell wall biosynthesis
MKVGLFVSALPAHSGGTYTFESQLLEAILESAPKTKHTFELYTKSSVNSKYLSDGTFQSVSIEKYSIIRINSKILKTIRSLFPSILPNLRHLADKLQIRGFYEKEILKLLKKNHIDVTFYLGQYCFVTDYPYIITVFDLQHRLQPYFPEVSISGQWNIREKFLSITLQRASMIITGTEVGKSEIQKFYGIPAERIKVIPFFTPQFSLHNALLEEETLAKYNLSPQYLFYPAQFWSHKNHIALLLAVENLKQKYGLKLTLVFVGSDKGNESYIRDVTHQLNLSDQVKFLGFVPQEDMICLYKHAFALTFVTFFGPDNLPPLEAMALGCPVIASNVSGAEEQLGNAALLVDPKNPEEIADAVKSLWENPALRQSLIQNGLARSQSWSVHNYAQEIFRLLDDFESIRRCWQ